jgi:hypothetical protein
LTTAQPPVTDAHAARPRRRRWPLVVGCLLLLCVLPVGLYFYLMWAEDRDEQAAVEEIERLDPRWRLDQILAERKPIAAEQNPALVVRNVQALMPPGDFDLGEKNWPLFDQLTSVNRLNGPQLAALREALTKHAEAVKLARTLSAFPDEGRFAIQVSPDFVNTNFEPLQRCRGIMSMLRHDAMLRAEDGDAAGALASCQAVLVAARAIGDEPFLIAALIRFAGESMVVAALERTLAQGEPPPAQLKVLQNLLAREINSTFFVQAVRGERAGGDAIFATLRKGDVTLSRLVGRKPGGTGRPVDDWLVDHFPGVMLRGRAEELRLMTRAIEAARLPAEKQGAAFDEIDKAARASSNRLVREQMPAVANVALHDRRAKAILRCALVAVAAERYRFKHERWPAAIDELRKDGLLAAVPLDPFDGAPLRWKLRTDGVVVYSVGQDGVDDGGAVGRQDQRAAGLDLGLRLWNVNLRRQDPLPPLPAANDRQP